MSILPSSRRLSTLFVLVLFAVTLQAQRYKSTIDQYLRQEKSQWNLTDQDISHYAVSSQYDHPESGLTYTYLVQQVNGIRIFNAVSTIVLKDGKVAHVANRFVPNAAKKANAVQPTISAGQAIRYAALHLGLTLAEEPQQLDKDADRFRYHYTKAGISKENIKAELIFVADEGLILAWNIIIHPVGTADGWNIRIDALTGEFIEKNNWTLYCDFGHPHADHSGNATCGVNQYSGQSMLPALSDSAVYNVFPFPVEAPSFGERELVTDPHLDIASPYGWHDTDGVEGPEHTITRGNNVYVYDDIQNFDSPGYSPDGGQELNFNFPQDLNVNPVENLDANLTNLFYANNVLHDILYVHGFDEAAGNFQETNYSGEGFGNDFVVAEGQDGGGTNNANFYTPEDGQNGRMQMYMWLTEAKTTMEITSPDSITGFYDAVEASFGPGLEIPVSGQAVLVVDAEDPFHDACDDLLNAQELEGKIAIIDKGQCSYLTKVFAAEAAGAIAMVVVQNVEAPPIAMGGNGGVNIPSVMISQADGERIKAALAAGDSVHLTLAFGSGASSQNRDGCLDNGIIAHELAHGLSNRLTGGPLEAGCLSHAEQGGEGWSDWLALITTIEPGDKGTDAREIASYSKNAEDGRGLRRFPYSTDMSINAQTYGDLAGSNGPHAVGEIWCSAIWDVTWALIDAEGFDPDLYGGNGGNHTALTLIIEGMKHQGCNPSYVDARNGILKADALLYDNAHRCLIWEAFAKRGLGAYADEGSRNAVGDETEDFSMPNLCLVATAPPKASFAVDDIVDCYGLFRFDDTSEDIPQYYQWDFGDGQTSEEENPIHIYDQPGTYYVNLIVTNNIGTDTFGMNITFGDPPVPVISGNRILCEGSQVTLEADVLDGNTAIWSYEGNEVHEGNSFTTPPLTTNTNYSVIQVGDAQVERVGPFSNTFWGGAIHNTGFEGRLLFEVLTPLTLQSVVVYAQGAADRTFNLYDENDQLIQSTTVFVENGQSRVPLNFEINQVGKYSIGNLSQNLYRNDGGARYPYTVDNLISIYSSNASGDELSYYYYFYNWEVQEIPCRSNPIEVPVVVEAGPVAGYLTDIADLAVNFTDISSGQATEWSWDFGDGNTSAEQNPTHSYTEAGEYQVTLTITNGSCYSVYQQIIEVGTTSIPDIGDTYGLNIFPNPATDEVNIRFTQPTSDKWQLNIVDAAGQQVLTRTLQPDATIQRLSIGHLPSGTYQFQFIAADGIAVRRVTVFK
jgi:PKD repeat protein